MPDIQDQLLRDEPTNKEPQHQYQRHSPKHLLAAREVIREPYHGGEQRHRRHQYIPFMLNHIVKLEHLPDQHHNRIQKRPNPAHQRKPKVPRANQQIRKDNLQPPEVPIGQEVMGADEGVRHVQQIAESHDEEVEGEVGQADGGEGRVG